ncbi:hypothetical protein NECAME_02669 [Necator americanus]|uniref:Uncharacterized protein n=1 Tax=Necator americanus TaxID=51031 RepID=W2TBM4_NECAM|nr:hypothetical protein NECAME_02669 [Necator americanus]ETN79243.1 hypothetical protein NECAME_02669 [Necator americanus]
MLRNLGPNAIYILAIAAVSLETISATKFMNFDPDQIMKDLEQYDVQEKHGATFDPEIYDTVLKEFSRFVRNDHDDGRRMEDFHETNRFQEKLQSQNSQEPSNRGKIQVIHPRDVSQREQHKPNNHIVFPPPH